MIIFRTNSTNACTRGLSQILYSVREYLIFQAGESLSDPSSKMNFLKSCSTEPVPAHSSGFFHEFHF